MSRILDSDFCDLNGDLLYLYGYRYSKNKHEYHFVFFSCLFLEDSLCIPYVDNRRSLLSAYAPLFYQYLTKKKFPREPMGRDDDNILEKTHRKN